VHRRGRAWFHVPQGAFHIVKTLMLHRSMRFAWQEMKFHIMGIDS